MKNIDRVVDVFLRCVRTSDKDDLGWSWWGLEDLPTGEVHSIDYDKYIREVFAVKLLMAAEKFSDAELAGYQLPSPNEIAPYIDTDGLSIRPILEGLKTPGPLWSKVITQHAIDRIPSLLKAFDNTIRAKNTEQRSKVIRARLSSAYVDEFSKEVVEGFQHRGVMNQLAEKHEILRNEIGLPLKPGAQKARGFNEVGPKEPFIDDGHISFSMLGNNYGEGVARDDDAQAFAALQAQFPIARTVKSTEELSGSIRKAILDLRSKGIAPNAVVTALNLEMISNLNSIPDFLPRWHKDCPKNSNPGFIGVYRVTEADKIAVYKVSVNPKVAGRSLCIVDLKKIGEIARLNPRSEDALDIGKLEGAFLIRVVDLNEDAEERKRILEQKTKWLDEFSDKDEYLRGRVLIQIYLRSEYRFNKATEFGIKIATEIPKLS